MAKRLTEEMVIARTKISDLSKIKRLNCWGSELGDVSLLKKMPSVEVLSLSINKINSLEDFSLCKRLEELYIRQNDIRDLNQIVYLQSLPNLKNLWLGENPCASIDGYRQAVLRALPNLQKLDNVAVTPEELKDALRKGKALCHPDDEQESEEEDTYIPAAATVSSQQYNNRYQQDYPAEPEYVSPHRSPSRQDPPIELENGEPETFYPSKEEPPEELPQELSPPRQLSPARRQADPATVTKRTYSPEQEYSEQRRRSSHDLGSPKYGHSNTQTNYYDRSPPFATNEDCTSNGASTDNYKEHRLVSSQSTNSILKEYTNGDRYGSNPPYRQQTEGSEVSYNQDNNSSTQQQRRERQFTPCAAAQRAPFTRRPVTRNSNILSAVLCLVKELDYPSLEVVEMAVRCRMDELDE